MKRSAIHRLAILLTVVCAAVCMTGCATPRLIRQAQDSFNAATRLEVERRAETGDPNGTLLEDVAISGSYRQTLAMLEEELENHRDELFRENLLGTGLVLKALCHWRLADLEGSAGHRAALDATLQEIRAGGDLGLGTRDRVLARALTGLRDHDRGLRASQFGGESGAEVFFCSAFSDLERSLAEENPPPDHPIRTYVELAKVSTLREWAFAAQSFLTTTPEQDDEKRALQPCFYTTAQRLESSPSAAARVQLRELAQKLGASWPLPPGQERDPEQDRDQCAMLIEQTCP